MNPAALKKVSAATAAEICRPIQFSEEIGEPPGDKLTPREFLDLMVARKKFLAALEFLAHALPKRETVYWGCLCAWHVGGANLPAPQKAALKAACTWVAEPSDDHRRAAGEAGESAEFSTTAGCIAMGVYWSAGNQAEPGQPPMEPDALLCPQVVGNGISLAAARADPAKFPNIRQQFLDLGIGVAEGRFVWPAGNTKT